MRIAGFEPALSIVYFYWEAYTKALVPKALATELNPRIASNENMREFVRYGGNVSPLRGYKRLLYYYKRTLTG